jgi:hypothetical protein
MRSVAWFNHPKQLEDDKSLTRERQSPSDFILAWHLTLCKTSRALKISPDLVGSGAGMLSLQIPYPGGTT